MYALIVNKVYRKIENKLKTKSPPQSMSPINCLYVLLYVEIAHMIANMIVISLDKFEINKIIPYYFKLHEVY